MVDGLPTGLDGVVLLIGANDVLSRTPEPRWEDDLGAVVDALGSRARQVLVPGLAPFARFPSLPTALARYLARRAEALDEVARSVCSRCPSAQWIPASKESDIGPDFFASDGFHPSAIGYDQWAAQVAACVRLP